jgi:adenylate kinase
VIRNRIEEYERKTAVVGEYYHRFSTLFNIKGEGGIEEIFQLLCEQIDNRWKE